MSKITIPDLIAHGAKGLSCILLPDGRFEGRVLNASGNGDVVSHDTDPNVALQAAKELHMEFAKRKAERPAPPPATPKRTRKPKAAETEDDGMDMV